MGQKQGVSPNYDEDKLKNATIEDRIDVYEDRVVGWTLNHAKLLAETEHGGFAALQIACSYFEQHWIHSNGEDSKSNSARAFTESFVAVYPPNLIVKSPDVNLPTSFSEEVAKTIYSKVRCGLFHDGFARYRVQVGTLPGPFAVRRNRNTGEIDVILIDPAWFIRRILKHFNAYIKQLRNSEETGSRAAFEKGWKITNHPERGDL